MKIIWKFLYENFPPSPTLSYTITKKPKQKFCAKVIECHKTPESLSDRVLFRSLVIMCSLGFSVIGSFLDFSVVGSSLWSSVIDFRWTKVFFYWLNITKNWHEGYHGKIERLEYGTSWFHIFFIKFFKATYLTW